MDKRYEVYCLVDPWFYDAPAHTGRDESHDFGAARRPVPGGWVRGELGDWLVYRPDGLKLPVQGWKIHASARLDNAEEILAAVWDYCAPRRISPDDTGIAIDRAARPGGTMGERGRAFHAERRDIRCRT